jgi:hypothetical protein
MQHSRRATAAAAAAAAAAAEEVEIEIEIGATKAILYSIFSFNLSSCLRRIP